ncbi:EAL domain-containing protein [Nitratireductor basaltis]|uniref:EAL domain protein n=1 Tax=Nitratireductor basaltis TaxID=472175 RepID=A0A084U9B2_9HYPH|nr:EAL domain-containing protein [Nitratireductor basaltis]KFB09548.1 EAL domain protein [Nitratireductor basaltis]
MSRSEEMAHIARQADGSYSANWGVHVLKSAFQPIFAFSEGKLRAAAYEGLIRPFREGKPVSPGAFFSAIPKDEQGVVESVARSLHLLNAAACIDRSAFIFVNFDPRHFDGALSIHKALTTMREALGEAGNVLAPERIVCEITEQKTLTESSLLDFVKALRNGGYRVAVDDYGAEDSDMRRIQALRPDVVKFDSAWVNRLMESDPGVKLLNEMVRQFTALGTLTIFEGIEQHWQLDLAEKAGVSMVQGFVLAKPELAPTSFGVFSTATRSTADMADQPAPPPAARTGAGPDVTPEIPVAPNRRTEARPLRPARVFGKRTG